MLNSWFARFVSSLSPNSVSGFFSRFGKSVKKAIFGSPTAADAAENRPMNIGVCHCLCIYSHFALFLHNFSCFSILVCHCTIRSCTQCIYCVENRKINDAGVPTDVRHTHHIGYDPESGFDVRSNLHFRLTFLFYFLFLFSHIFFLFAYWYVCGLSHPFTHRWTRSPTISSKSSSSRASNRPTSKTRRSPK